MSSAQQIFEEFVAAGEGSGAGLEDLCSRHPERAARLRELWEDYRRMSGLLDAVGGEAREEADATSGVRYEVRGEIARGGMGRVLEVWDGELRRTLAMKVLRTERPVGGPGRVHWERQRSRLLNEAQILGQLEHPGIVPIHEVGRDEHGRPFFTMLRVRGRALGEILEDVAGERGGWTRTRVVGVLQRVCEAVAHAHAKGVIHRDLKPSNVMVGPFGEVYVMDWGLAKARGREGAADIRLRTSAFESADVPASDLVAPPSVRTDRRDASGAVSPLMTMDGDVLGTPSYMAPEQAAGRVAEVDERSDVYSAGAMLYHLLSGSAPYLAESRSSNPHEVLRAVRGGEPEPLEQLAPETPAELAAVCAKAMARDREARYASMAELAEDLRAHLEERVVRAHRTGPMVELTKWMRRHRMVVALLGAFLVVLLGSAVALAWLYRDASAQRQRAEQRLQILMQNPSGYRKELDGIPTLESFVEDFSAGALERPLRFWSHPESAEWREGMLVLNRPGSATSDVSLGLDDSLALMRGDFELSLAFDAEGFGVPETGTRFFGINVRRAHDGALVGAVQRRAVVSGEEVITGYTALGKESIAHFDRTGGRTGKLRLARTGGRIRADVWLDEWRTLLDMESDRDPLQFIVYARSIEGDEGEFQVAFDELRYVTSAAAPTPVGALRETFDDGLGTRLRQVGDAGVAGTVDGRLLIEKFQGVLGFSYVEIDSLRYVLRGDFDVRLDYEILEFSPSTGCGVSFELIAAMVGEGKDAAKLSCVPGPPAMVQARDERTGEVVSTEVGSALKGRWRIARTGARLRLDTWDGGWRELLSVEDCSQALAIRLGVTDLGALGSLLVAVDDLHVDGLFTR